MRPDRVWVVYRLSRLFKPNQLLLLCSESCNQGKRFIPAARDSNIDLILRYLKRHLNKSDIKCVDTLKYTADEDVNDSLLRNLFYQLLAPPNGLRV